LGLEANNKICNVRQNVGFVLVFNWWLHKDDLKFLKQLKGVNEKSNRIRMFKHYKHVGLIRDDITIKMNREIGCQLHGFHNKQKIIQVMEKLKKELQVPIESYTMSQW
jgi:hypothetical protein